MPGVLQRHWPVGLTLVRIEDIDPPRDVPGAGEAIIKALARFGMTSDEPILWQHDRLEAYADALAKLTAEGFIYGCACSRKEIQLADEALGLPIGVYPCPQAMSDSMTVA